MYYKNYRKKYNHKKRTEYETFIDSFCVSKHFLFSQFTGGWFFIYHFGSEEDDDNLDYLTDYYDVPDGNGSRITTHVYDKKCVQ